MLYLDRISAEPTLGVPKNIFLHEKATKFETG